MNNDLTAIENELHGRGMSTYRQQPNQLVVSRQHGLVWPDRGNSFWVCNLASHWYVCTWAPYYYHVPAESSIVEVCDAFVDIGQSAQPRVPADLVARFSLVETDHDDFDDLWEAAGPMG